MRKNGFMVSYWLARFIKSRSLESFECFYNWNDTLESQNEFLCAKTFSLISIIFFIFFCFVNSRLIWWPITNDVCLNVRGKVEGKGQKVKAKSFNRCLKMPKIVRGSLNMMTCGFSSFWTKVSQNNRVYYLNGPHTFWHLRVSSLKFCLILSWNSKLNKSCFENINMFILNITYLSSISDEKSSLID